MLVIDKHSNLANPSESVPRVAWGVSKAVDFPVFCVGVGVDVVVFKFADGSTIFLSPEGKIFNIMSFVER